MFNFNFNQNKKQKKSRSVSGLPFGSSKPFSNKNSEKIPNIDDILRDEFLIVDLCTWIKEGKINIPDKEWDNLAYEVFSLWYGFDDNAILKEFMNTFKKKVSLEGWKEIIEAIKLDFGKDDPQEVIPLINKHLASNY
jgi:hypothetical protein